MEKSVRASKKQRELLQFIDGFIKGTGYGPSYREIMRALGYKSVSTVAIHINGLIAAGLVRKTTNSARSLELIAPPPSARSSDAEHKKWLKEQVKAKLAEDINDEDKQALKRAIELLLPKSE